MLCYNILVISTKMHLGILLLKKKSLMNLNVNAILKLILFERILMYTLCDLSNRDLVQYWLQNCSYFINVTALLKTIVFDAYLLKTFLINEIFVNNTYRT